MIVFYPISAKAQALDISAEAGVVMILQTGETVFSKNESRRLSMASTTKIMTSLLALEKGNLYEEFEAGKNDVTVEGTSMGLLPGDRVTVYALVAGMLLQSGNDGANVTANRIGGTGENFVRMMNDRAREIGMKNTNFVTPSGLDDENHYSTAYDMALLACEALRNHMFKSICSAKKLTVSYGDPPYERTLYNHNRLLSSYDGCFGIKTGFTKKSGRCLVSAAEKNGITLVAVTLNAPDDWNDHRKMLDYGFLKVKKQNLSEVKALKVRVLDGDKSYVEAKEAHLPQLHTGVSAEKIKCENLLYPFEFAPVKKGDVLGERIYKADNKILMKVPLIAKNDVDCNEINSLSFFERLYYRIKERIKSIF